MDIKSSLMANSSNAPLVFMGGTCPGPKWRDRLTAQVQQAFRWYNPVVTEWTAKAQELEIAVRKEADILLYVLNPYQEGFYSLIEATEDAIRSEKKVVIGIIPTYEDKSFNDKQWNSLIAAKAVWERHGAVVKVSMEELVDWFSKYNPNVVDNSVITADELIKKSEQQEQAKAPVQPAAENTPKLQKAIVDEAKAVDSEKSLAKEGQTQPTNPAMSSESYDDNTPILSMEGWISKIFGSKKDNKKPTLKKFWNHQAVGIKNLTSTDDYVKFIKETLANPEWIKEAFGDKESISFSGPFVLFGGNDIVKNITESGKQLKTWAKVNAAKVDKFDQQLRKADDKIQTVYEGLTEDNDIVTTIPEMVRKEFGSITWPFRNRERTLAIIGGWFYQLEYVQGKGLKVVQAENKTKPIDIELKVSDIPQLAKAISENLETLTDISDDIGYPGIYEDEGYWRSQLLWDHLFEKDTDITNICNEIFAEGQAGEMAVFVESPIASYVRTCAKLLDIIISAGGYSISFEQRESSPLVLPEYLGGNLSQEGVWDTIVGLFKGNKETTWNQRLNTELKQTWCNRSWVEQHHVSKQIKNKSINEDLLGINPLTVENVVKRCNKFIGDFNRIVSLTKPYTVKLQGLDKEAARRLKGGADHDEVAKWFLGEFRKLRYPLGKQVVEIVNGNNFEILNQGEYRLVYPYKVTDTPLPELSVDDILKISEVITKLGDELTKFNNPRDLYPFFDLEDGSFDTDLFDYNESEAVEALGDALYFQGDDMSVLYELFYELEKGFDEAMNGLGKWLHLATGGKSISQESLDALISEM